MALPGAGSTCYVNGHRTTSSGIMIQQEHGETYVQVTLAGAPGLIFLTEDLPPDTTIVLECDNGASEFRLAGARRTGFGQYGVSTRVTIEACDISIGTVNPLVTAIRRTREVA